MIDWSTTALVFPGQGSQEVGMGADLVQQYPEAAQIFQQADQILGIPFSKLCFEGPAELLDETVNTQPALYIHSIAMLRALEAKLGTKIAPVAVAGHSLGEFTALTAAGALSFADGVKLVRERASLMQEAGKNSKGAMAALLGIEIAAAREDCEIASSDTGKPVVVANDNCPGQIVISGDEIALEYALPLAQERGAKRALRLSVSIAAHSPLIADAAEQFHKALIAVQIETPTIPVIGNVSAAPLRDREAIYAELDAQLTSTVRWAESVRALIGMGATTFLEIGSKEVLTGLLKRIDRSATGIAINSADAIKALE